MTGSLQEIPVLVLGSSPTALAVLRELAQAGGQRLYLADMAMGCAARSRYKRAFFRLASWQDLERVAQTIYRQHRQTPLLIPTSDEAIAATQEAWSEGILFKTFASHTNGQAVEFLDKQKLATWLQEFSDFSLPLTANRVPADDSTPVPLPFFCKPRQIHVQRDRLSGKKGLIIHNKNEWREWLLQFGKNSDDWLFQEIIAGSEDNIALYVGAFDAQGDWRGEFTARKLRQYPPGFGSASLAISESLPGLASRARSFLQQSGFKGLCCGEFKWCQKRQDWVVIEFNPRPSLWYGLVSASGQSLLPGLLADLIAEKSAPFSRPGKKAVANELADGERAREAKPLQKVLWRYGLKDWAAAFFYRRHGKHFVLPPPRVKHRLRKQGYRKASAVFQWDDPLPLLGELVNYAQKGWLRFKPEKQKNLK